MGMLIHGPLLHLLRSAAVTELTETGKYTLWRVDAEQLHLAALDGARRLLKSGRHVLGMCPVMWLNLKDCDRFETEPGVSVSNMTELRKRLLVSHYGPEFVDDDMTSWASSAFIEFDQVLPETSDDDVARLVAAAIDRVKWAVLQCLDGTAPLQEGPVILRSPGGGRVRTMRRGESAFRGSSTGSYEVDSAACGRITQLVGGVRKAQVTTAEVEQAMWHFGRACTAPMGRDAVLESTIGLEHLLVPDAGESRYKFCLHGLALLGRSEGDAVIKDLDEIYGLRSKAAHGSSKSERGMTEAAPRARRLLAQAIQVVTDGINSGALDVSKTKGDIGQAVKNFVFATVKAGAMA